MGHRPQHARKCISANVHVKTLLNKLAAELGGGEVEEGTSATSGHISLQAAHNIHKVVLKLEVAVKNAHIRIEEPGRELLNNAGAARGPSVPAVAFGVCLRDLSLGFDERAGVEAGGALVGQGWFGKKFRAMETSLFGNFCERGYVLDFEGGRILWRGCSAIAFLGRFLPTGFRQSLRCTACSYLHLSVVPPWAGSVLQY